MAKRLVFTPIGGAVLVIALLGLIRSLINRNSYEIVLTCAALLILLCLFITGFWKSKKLKLLEPGWIPPFPMTANVGSDLQFQTKITGLNASVPLFFRQHFYIRGRFLCTKKGCHVSVETSVPRSETSAHIILDFPMSGLFLGDGYCRLRDIFGFFSFPCGLPQHRTVNIRCAPCFGKKTHINAQTGAEDQRNKPAADIERYYMREYTPGDRFRDINWKSSEKIDTLITRISTDNQEKVSRLEIHFRNYGPVDASLHAFWLLDRSKARLSYFLRSLMEQSNSFIFDVRAAGKNWEIKDNNDLGLFFEDLACLAFTPVKHETSVPLNTGDLYVFSTACDIGLAGFLLLNNPRPVTLFMVQPVVTGIEKDIELLKISDFLNKGCIPSLRWFSQKKVQPLAVHANKIEMFNAGIKL